MSDAAVIRRKKRSLGLVKLGVATASGIGSGILGTGAGALTAAKFVGLGVFGTAKLGAVVAIAKTLLGKCRN